MKLIPKHQKGKNIFKKIFYDMGFDPATLKRFKSDIAELQKYGLFPSGHPGVDIASAPVAITSRMGTNTINYINKMNQPGLFGDLIFQGTNKGLSKVKKLDKTIKERNRFQNTGKTRPYNSEIYNIETGEIYTGGNPNGYSLKPGWATR